MWKWILAGAATYYLLNRMSGAFSGPAPIAAGGSDQRQMMLQAQQMMEQAESLLSSA